MFDNLRKKYNFLCTPSQIYVLLSAVTIIGILLQNISESHRYCVGNIACSLQFNNLFIFAGKVVWMLFWAIVLDSLCKNGYKRLAWIVVLFPIIALLLASVFFIFSQL